MITLIVCFLVVEACAFAFDQTCGDDGAPGTSAAPDPLIPGM